MASQRTPVRVRAAVDYRVGDLVRDRDRVAGQVRTSSTCEMGGLGLVTLSLRLREIDDLGEMGISGSDPLLS
ncbi:hypothetical protein GCM10027176_19400 [Actinoallomurus bryophytorum]|uniref:Uncharacterized protein n=1 Tax=Actinoallomurus bryophytorum TaxID=1490222 RepID=A0A543CL05_9ACTN|nr:hypothetical protein [Actinoallomurus bryophytorum]TQL97783.1 hypothetical protein FB559_3389 [Actinoallomurus bryophytorum]